MCVSVKENDWTSRNGPNLRPSLSLSGLQATNTVSLKAFSRLLDYRHKKVSGKLYKQAVRTWEAYMSQRVDDERARFRRRNCSWELH